MIGVPVAERVQPPDGVSTGQAPRGQERVLEVGLVLQRGLGCRQGEGTDVQRELTVGDLSPSPGAARVFGTRGAARGLHVLPELATRIDGVDGQGGPCRQAIEGTLQARGQLRQSKDVNSLRGAPCFVEPVVQEPVQRQVAPPFVATALGEPPLRSEQHRPQPLQRSGQARIAGGFLGVVSLGPAIAPASQLLRAGEGPGAEQRSDGAGDGDPPPIDGIALLSRAQHVGVERCQRFVVVPIGPGAGTRGQKSEQLAHDVQPIDQHDVGGRVGAQARKDARHRHRIHVARDAAPASQFQIDERLRRPAGHHQPGTVEQAARARQGRRKRARQLGQLVRIGDGHAHDEGSG